MDRKQIEQWAREACRGFEANSPDDAILGIEAIERFAALVAAHEREQCALVCERMFRDGALVIAAAIRARGEVSQNG